VKKCLLWFAVVLFLATVSAPPIAKADAPDPTCGPNGCSKPGVQRLLKTPADAPDPTCGPNGCQKPGV
jgi:hypothetical protein